MKLAPEHTTENLFTLITAVARALRAQFEPYTDAESWRTRAQLRGAELDKALAPFEPCRCQCPNCK
jgi:hypothetical protein